MFIKSSIEHLQQIKNLRLMHLMSYVVPMKKFQKTTMFKLTFFDKVWLPNYNKNCSIKSINLLWSETPMLEFFLKL